MKVSVLFVTSILNLAPVNVSQLPMNVSLKDTTSPVAKSAPPKVSFAMNPQSYNSCKTGLVNSTDVTTPPAYLIVALKFHVLVVATVSGFRAAPKVIPHASPASYPVKPKTLVTKS